MSVDKKLAELVRDQPEEDLSDLTYALFREFEGAKGLARVIKSEFDAASKGSNLRARVLMSLSKLIENNTKINPDDADPSQMDDETLRLEALPLMMELFGSAESTDINPSAIEAGEALDREEVAG